MIGGYRGSCIETSALRVIHVEFFPKELRSREDEINEAAVQQREQEEVLKRREQELAQREIELVERELNIMILQQIMSKPTPKKRKGKFRKSRLKLLKAGGGKNISQPSGQSLLLVSPLSALTFTFVLLADFRHNITVQQEQYDNLRSFKRHPSSPDSPPSSPGFPRLRAIACTYLTFNYNGMETMEYCQENICQCPGISMANCVGSRGLAIRCLKYYVYNFLNL